MANNNFVPIFQGALENLGKKLNLPQLSLNKDHSCKLKYNDEFELEIVVIPDGGFQLHAYIVPIHAGSSKENLCEKLLELNSMDSKMFGCFFGINTFMKSIVLNYVSYQESIESSELANVLHNFISKAREKKDEIQNYVIHSVEKQSPEVVAPVAGHMNPEHLALLAGRV